MGYRSDVAYIIRMDKAKAKEFVALVRLKGGHMFNSLKECDVVAYPDAVDFNFCNEGVKWYDGYDSVDGHNSLLMFISDEFNEHAGYRFIRIGENDDDVETMTGGNEDFDPWEDFYITRGINVPFSYKGGHGDKITELDSLIGDNNDD